MELDPLLVQTICKALGLKSFPITAATLAFQVPGWDSLNHVSVIYEVENAYKVRFNSGEVGALKNVGELQELVNRIKAQ